jgi:DNA-binding MarR family transcriptional regulator
LHTGEQVGKIFVIKKGVVQRIDEDFAPDANAPMDRVPELDYGVLDTLMGYSLRRAQNALYLDFYAATEDFGLSPQRFAALVLIDSNPGIRQGLLGQAMGIGRSGALRLVDWLEARRLVAREPDAADARIWGLHLTVSGRRTLQAMTKAVQAHDQALVDSLGPEGMRLKVLLDLLASKRTQ